MVQNTVIEVKAELQVTCSLSHYGKIHSLVGTVVCVADKGDVEIQVSEVDRVHFVGNHHVLGTHDSLKKEKEQKGHRQHGQETHSKPRINTLNSEFKTSGETRTNEELDRSLSKHSFVKNEYLGSHHSSRTVCFDSETKGCGFG